MDIFNSWIVNKPIAHRGFFNYSDAPENSLKSFERAIEKGYAIELDVHIIADDTIIVFHDKELSRMTGKDGYTKNLTLEKLKDYKLGKSNETIPTLKQVFDLVNGRTPILIEIKDFSLNDCKLEKQLLKLMREYKGELAIQSFNPFSLAWFAKNAPEYWRGILSSFFNKNDPDTPKSWFRRYILKRMFLNKNAKPNFISYNIENLPNRFVNKYKNLPLLGWTVKSQKQYLDKVKFVDNIIFQDFEPKI